MFKIVLNDGSIVKKWIKFLSSPGYPHPVISHVDTLLAAAGVDVRVEEQLPVRQGAVATVSRIRTADGRELAVKEYSPSLASRAAAEVAALRAVEHVSEIPAPVLLGAIREGPRPCVVMTWQPGRRLDTMARWRAALPAIGALLRRLHSLAPPAEVPEAPWLEGVEEYAERGGPHAQLVLDHLAGLEPQSRVLCHGDPSTGNLLAVPQSTGIQLTGLVDWERSAAGDAIRELARATFHCSRGNPQARDALCAGYGLSQSDRPRLEALELVHAAELWNWWDTTGELDLLKQLETELSDRFNTQS